MENHFEGGREVEMRRRMRQAPDPLAMPRAVAGRAPTRAAILHLRTASDAEPEGYNYASAAEAAARLAAALTAAGVGPDDTVAIIAPSANASIHTRTTPEKIRCHHPLGQRQPQENFFRYMPDLGSFRGFYLPRDICYTLASSAPIFRALTRNPW